jgi:hypothetical protein
MEREYESSLMINYSSLGGDGEMELGRDCFYLWV